jgi:hypothetical protein
LCRRCPGWCGGRGDGDVRFDNLAQLAAIVKNRLKSFQYRARL